MEKILMIELTKEIIWTAVLIGIGIAMLGGIIYFSRKLSRDSVEGTNEESVIHKLLNELNNKTNQDKKAVQVVDEFRKKNNLEITRFELDSPNFTGETQKKLSVMYENQKVIYSKLKNGWDIENIELS